MHLEVTLSLAVPLEIIRLKRLSPSEFDAALARAPALAQVVAEKGDVLQFGGKTRAAKESTAEAFAALARGLALLAFVPGGVRFSGLHFLADRKDTHT